MGLQKRFGKTKAMVFNLGFIWGKLGSAAYKRRAMGEGATLQERNKTRVCCEKCGGGVAESSLYHHMDRVHRILLPHTRGVDIGFGGPDTYVVSSPQVLNLVAFMVDGCLDRANNPGRLREHLMYRHWKSKGGNSIGGTRTLSTMQLLWYAYVSGLTD